MQTICNQRHTDVRGHCADTFRYRLVFQLRRKNSLLSECILLQQCLLRHLLDSHQIHAMFHCSNYCPDHVLACTCQKNEQYGDFGKKETVARGQP